MSKVETTHDDAGLWDWPLQQNDEIVKVHNTHSHFEVSLDCQFFNPKEIGIQVHDHELNIHCRHESRHDQFGTISRQIHRTYKLPEDVDQSSVRSHLNDKGILHITANKLNPKHYGYGQGYLPEPGYVNTAREQHPVPE